MVPLDGKVICFDAGLPSFARYVCYMLGMYLDLLICSFTLWFSLISVEQRFKIHLKLYGTSRTEGILKNALSLSEI